MPAVQYALTPPLSVLLLSRVAGYLAKQLEPRLRRKRFNALGALRFDADVRALVGALAGGGDGGGGMRGRVRARLTRLLQMARLLTVDAAAEAAELWDGGRGGCAGAAWELSADEVRAVLALRVDLPPAELAKVRLQLA